MSNVFNQDSLFEQMANISKAGAYDIIVQHRDELLHENSLLKIKLQGAEARIKALQEFINDVRPKDSVSAELPRITEEDIDPAFYSKPGSKEPDYFETL